MSASSRDELEVLAGARRALGPSAQDSARVLHKARLAIGSGAAPAADAVVSSATAKNAIAKKLASWLAVAGIAAWLGYSAGFNLGEQRARDVRVRAAQPAAPARVEHAQVPALPRVDVEPAGAAAQLQAPKPKRKQKPAAQPMLVPDAPDAPEVISPTASQPSPSLDAEIKALRFVERALRNREPKIALARLAQLDRDVPQGQMRQERAAARAMARCEARALEAAPDRAEVMQRVLEFSQQYPASVYFARVRQTCLATIDRDAATD